MTRRLRTALTVVAVAALSGCGPGVLDPAGPVGRGERAILVNSLAIMLAIVVPTILATLAFAWWFRESNRRATYRPDFVYSGRIEIIVWSIPILVIMFLGGVIWIGSHALDPARPLPSKEPPLEVQVVSLDWKWLFIYPQQGVARVNELVLPVGRPVRFDLTSSSVMNVFFVPRLGSEIYTMNGMVSRLNLQADQPGEYEGLSAHFSGDGFPHMRFKVRALPAPAFDAWVRGARGQGPALDLKGYGELARQSVVTAPVGYGAVAPDLFQAIASQAAPPGPGPQTGRGGPQVSPQPER